jgi:hypothetical protein
VTVFVLSAWLSRLYGLPRDVLLFIGAANLLYASCSFSLARRSERPLSLIKLLVYANGAWALVCVGLAAYFWGQATAFGLAHLIGEALIVGGLAGLEWNQRHRLASAGRGFRPGPG